MGARMAIAGIAAGLAVSLVAGCTFPTEQAYRDNVQSWVGRTADNLVLAWGAPDRSYDFSDGTRQLEYDRQQTRYVAGAPIYTAVPVQVRDGNGHRRTQFVSVWRDTPGYLDVDRCLTRFRVGRDNRVREVSFNGDWCVAYPPRQPGGAPEASDQTAPPASNPAPTNAAPRS
jgi:hypothetical protein